MQMFQHKTLLLHSKFLFIYLVYLFCFQIYDGRGDCSDFSDECPEVPVLEDFFSSRFQLIANPILRGIVWLMGILAFVGNIVSLGKTLLKIL